MARWVPPIPTERLYSAPAMELGAGLALLVWCYDGVERDGAVKIELDAAAGALGKPYRTVKEWWRLLREGPFFSSVRDRGKLGFVATFDRDWIEWRVMATNYPPTDGEGQPDVLDDTPSKPVQSPVKGASKPGEGQPDVLDDRVYKVLHTISDHVAPIASDDAPTPAPEIAEPAPIRKPRKAKAAAPVTPPAEPSEHKRLMTAYAEILGYPFPNGGKEAAGARKLLDTGYTVEQVIAAYCEMKAQAFWASKHVSLHNVIQDIGAIVNRQDAKQRAAAGRANGAYQNGAPRHHVAPSDPGILDAAEMRRQMAELLGGGK